jgi:hypothetical protein
MCGLPRATVRDLRFAPPRSGSRFRSVLTETDALKVAERHQHRAVRDAAEFAALLGEPVGFLVRTAPGGTVFEAIALGSARTCAFVDEHGTLRRHAGAPRGSTWDREPSPAPRFPAATRRAAERALTLAARPRPRRARDE